MLFLDTNALFFYLGREKIGEHSCASVDIPKLKRFLDCRDDKVLATSSYIEAMVKFRNDPLYAKIMQEFMFHKRLRLFNNVYNQVFTRDEINSSLALSSKDLVNYIMYKILPLKIKLEVDVSFVIFMSIIALFADCLLKKHNSICYKCDREIKVTLLNDIASKSKEILFEALYDAYNNHPNYEQQHFKNEFQKELANECRYLELEIESILQKEMNSDDMDRVKDGINNKYEAMLHNNNNSVMDYVSKEIQINSMYTDAIKCSFAGMFSNKGFLFAKQQTLAFRGLQIEYLAENLYTSWLDKAQRYRKNDLFDLLFLGCAEYQDPSPSDIALLDKTSYLLTFDKRLDKFIEIKRSENGKMIRRFFNDF